MAITDQQDRVGRVIARALHDEAFKAQLLNDPRGTFDTAGVDIPDGVTLRFVENTADVIHLTLPYVPRSTLLDTDAFALANSDVRSAVGRNTPKDVGCCGGSSSIGAVWLEDDVDAMPKPAVA